MHSQLDVHHHPVQYAVGSVSHHQILVFRRIVKCIFRAPTKLLMVSGLCYLQCTLQSNYKSVIIFHLHIYCRNSLE